ncbi:sensor domain-containing diguanylate cyclase [Lysinibacillus mangiferihumi]|uniref:Sensor domain-containing diguanylate cyclase n=1 Tax=Lysinibacillus mangiferihumi TaxID=1130819 RepID=A0A4U2XZX9_9BACI|nr:PAS domain S-box protein [Lysinibacillus mangiferihumi]TKI53587.1 sensor domain-containing diguanylate cyclase [Lysinibacillus mangiferihumi]
MIKSIKEEAITSASGEVVWVQTVKVPIHINDSATLLAVSTDITERKRYEDEIKFQANHDALTGLPNRRMFNEDLIVQQNLKEVKMPYCSLI